VEPIVRFESVCKSFGSTRVLWNLDLEVAASEKVAVIGPSGSGKSTILRVLMALEGIDAGSVEVCGETLWSGPTPERLDRAQRTRLRRMRRKVGMVFQHFNLFPHHTVLGNLTLAPQQVLGLPADEAAGRAKELLGRVGLLDKAGSYPAALSGGQKQRVAIARALAMQPEIMLFDEVTSALDPELVGEVLQVLRHLAREGRMTMILVTHQMDFAAEIADRVVFVDEGRVVEQGTPDEVLSRPRRERTRAFLGALLER
jgi:polar amino acid transport system ATP-binding protein